MKYNCIPKGTTVLASPDGQHFGIPPGKQFKCKQDWYFTDEDVTPNRNDRNKAYCFIVISKIDCFTEIAVLKSCVKSYEVL